MGLCSGLGAGKQYVEELWRRQRVVMEEACMDCWDGGDDGQHSVFFCLFVADDEAVMGDGGSIQDSAVRVVSMEAVWRATALCKLSRGSPFWAQGCGAKSGWQGGV